HDVEQRAGRDIGAARSQRARDLQQLAREHHRARPVAIEQRDGDERAPRRLAIRVTLLACHVNPLCAGAGAMCGMVDVRPLLGSASWEPLQRKSAARALWALAVNWGLVVAAFALAIAWPTPAGVLVALVVLGGRQLGLGILMHDCAHRALFPSP